MTCVQAGPGVGALLGLAAQDGRDPGLPRVLALHVGVLDEQQPSGPQQEGSLLGERTHDLQPVGSSVERQVGVVVAHLRLARDRVLGHVRGVGDDHVHGSAQVLQRPTGRGDPGCVGGQQIDRTARSRDLGGMVLDVRRGPATASSDSSTAITRLPGTSVAIDRANAAEPEQRSTTSRPEPGCAAANSSTWSTISSVSGRGMNTPGPTRSSR